MRRMFEGGAVDRLVRRPFGFWPQTLDRWEAEGFPHEVREDQRKVENFGLTAVTFDEYFGFDPDVWMGQPVDLGWCEAPLCPPYEEKVLKVEGPYEVVQDFVGRVKRYPRGVRVGVMPTYLKHAVASREDWEREVRPRLDSESPPRWVGYAKQVAERRAALGRGERLYSANACGGYMYLRSLIGPTELLYAFHDAPDLVRSMMETWRTLMVTCLKRCQADVGPFFRLFLAEDICYRSGPLISPVMMRTFLLPYYRELYQELRAGQLAPLHFEIDTDGDCRPVIGVYREVGVDGFSPMEVAACEDVVEVGRRWPDLHLRGGMDKRVLAAGPEAIDRMLEHIMPPMVQRGRFIPCCDHAVPDDVSLANYVHYRRRVHELDH